MKLSATSQRILLTCRNNEPMSSLLLAHGVGFPGKFAVIDLMPAMRAANLALLKLEAMRDAAEKMEAE